MVTRPSKAWLWFWLIYHCPSCTLGVKKLGVWAQSGACGCGSVVHACGGGRQSLRERERERERASELQEDAALRRGLGKV